MTTRGVLMVALILASPLAIHLSHDQGEIGIDTAVLSASRNDFELASLPDGWQTSGDQPWSIQNNTVINGSFSAQSGPIISNQYSKLEIIVNAVNGTGEFAYQTSSEANWDFLVFCIDLSGGCLRTSGYTMRWSGITAGIYQFPVTAGFHTYTWVYWKDSSVSSTQDTVWIDDVYIPETLDYDGDGWTDAQESVCGSDGLDIDSVPDDYDGDGVCDKVDTDDDGDGIGDNADAFSLDSTEWLDTDGDGIGDNADEDDDNDGWIDENEVGCGTDPLDDSSVPDDYDADSVCDPLDADVDGDGYVDTVDAFPMDPNEWADFDGDGIGDNAETDWDNDGLEDNSDACPFVPGTSWKDRIGCPDSDIDGWSDEGETSCNSEPNMAGSTPVDTDGDGICNLNDANDDNDSYYDELIMDSGTGFADDCPRVWGNSTDERHGCPDSDGDGVADIDDGFPNDPHKSWDRDGDGLAEEEESKFLDIIHENDMPLLMIVLFFFVTLACWKHFQRIAEN